MGDKDFIFDFRLCLDRIILGGRVENRQKPFHNQTVNVTAVFIQFRQISRHIGGDDCIVVSNLAVIYKPLGRFINRQLAKILNSNDCVLEGGILVQAIQNFGNFTNNIGR